MNDSERVAKAWRDVWYDDLVHSMRPSTSSGAIGGRGDQRPLGMGNLSGWATSAGLIGAVLGGIAGQGLVGALMGALLFGGGLWVLSFLAKRSGAWHRDARPLVWLVGGAVTGAVIGAVLSATGSDPLWFAVKTWAIFLGGLSWLFCWICRGCARRDFDPEAVRRYNEEWEAKQKG